MMIMHNNTYKVLQRGSKSSYMISLNLARKEGYATQTMITRGLG